MLSHNPPTLPQKNPKMPAGRAANKNIVGSAWNALAIEWTAGQTHSKTTRTEEMLSATTAQNIPAVSTSRPPC